MARTLLYSLYSQNSTTIFRVCLCIYSYSVPLIQNCQEKIPPFLYAGPPARREYYARLKAFLRELEENNDTETGGVFGPGIGTLAGIGRRVATTEQTANARRRSPSPENASVESEGNGDGDTDGKARLGEGESYNDHQRGRRKNGRHVRGAGVGAEAGTSTDSGTRLIPPSSLESFGAGQPSPFFAISREPSIRTINTTGSSVSPPFSRTAVGDGSVGGFGDDVSSGVNGISSTLEGGASRTRVLLVGRRD